MTDEIDRLRAALERIVDESGEGDKWMRTIARDALDGRAVTGNVSRWRRSVETGRTLG